MLNHEYNEENKVMNRMEEEMRKAKEDLLHTLGVDESIFSEFQHGYNDAGIYRGDIPEDPKNDKYDYGTPRHSGRYPWGSGDNPYQRNASFLAKVDQMKKAKGKDGKPLYSEKQVAAALGMNTSDLRKKISLANAENRAYLSSEAKRLKAKGMSTSAIARRMGRNESSIRLLLDEEVNERMSSTAKNATILKERVNKYDYIDVGKGSEQYLGISSTSLGNALHALEQEGYTLHDVAVEQLGTGKTTTVKVLAKPGVELREVYKNRDKIHLVTDVYSEDGGDTMRPIKEYVSVDPKRIQINYAETGGKNKDGTIELRRGVDDISLGKNHYAQVRILVDGDRYMKGMAMYADDLPPGIDIRFNTSKHEGTPMGDVFKKIKDDRENPFGANLKPDEKLTLAQRHYIDKDGVERQSALNIVKEEGDVEAWNKKLPSQFLSKQSPELARQQLKMAYDISKSDFDEIASYSNPTVKASMLEDFAGRCESDAVHLAAAALPRQANKFILPLTNIHENEIYAPGYRDGEEVALVRFPHGNISEIPKLIVNNRNDLAKSIIGDALDAVGIHPKAAQRLSGADFDGDTVLVIPTENVKIRNKEQFPGLKNFDPDELYPKYPGMHIMTDHEKGLEMGKVTNLITDMTIHGAPTSELERAVRHSMVIIDAQKHELDYKRSERENRIPELKAKYQAGGASTLLSRSTREEHIPERKEKAFSKMTPEEKERWKNGEQIFVNTGKTDPRTDFMPSRMTKEEKAKWDTGDQELMRQVRASMIADGRERRKEKARMVRMNEGALHDPYSLVSGGSREKTTPIERVYADHALAMKDLARQARKLAREQVDISYNPEAAKKYSREVESLNAKLSIALRNAPLERLAQIKANKAMQDILYNNPELKNDKEHYKREKGRQLDAARKAVGAKKLTIGGSDKNPLTDREWEAIQAGAITKTKLRQIISNSDKGRIRELALPKTHKAIPSAKLSMAKSMLKKGYTRAEVCDRLDISDSTLVKEIGIENL